MIENIFYHEEKNNNYPAWILSGLFLFALLASAFIFHFFCNRDIYFANYPIWDVKYQYLKNWKKSPDILFVGSSHIYRHVIPEVIEDSLDHDNNKPQVVNLGVSDLSLVEFNLMIGELKRKKENNESLPSYVVIDPFVTAGRVERLKNWSTVRAIKNHTLLNTLYLLSFEWYQTTAKKTLILLYHSLSDLLSLSANLLNVGVLNEKVFSNQLSYMPPDEAVPNMVSDKGYIPLGEEVQESVTHRMDKIYQEHTTLNKDDVQFNPNYLDFFDSISDSFDDLGIQVVLIATPVLGEEKSGMQKKAIDAFKKNKPNVIFLDYSDLLIEPQYRNSHFWHDQGHLTEAGARLFSEKLGADLKKIIREKG